MADIKKFLSYDGLRALSNNIDNKYANQNAFSSVAIGDATITADSVTDTLTIVPGSNVTITPDTANDKITIAAKDTTYSAATTSAAGLMSATDKAKVNATNIAFGACSTAAATAAKEIDIVENTSWTLGVGSIVVIKFSETNTAQNPTFNVNNTGAKSVWYNTSVITTGSLNCAGYKDRYGEYIYDGTQYVFLGWSVDSNTTYTNASLGNGYGTCSTAAATTAKVVTLSGYALSTGGQVSVKFTNAVPAGATMNINSKGAKAIYYKGKAITDGIICAGEVATFVYDGTRYHLLTVDRNRFFTSLVPYGVAIPENADLNTIEYLKVGNYYCSSNAITKTLVNCPAVTTASDGTKSGTAFMMTVSSPLSQTVDDESSTWKYRFRTMQLYNGPMYTQYCYSNGTAGNWIYGTWYQRVTTPVQSAVGSATKPVYINHNGYPVACNHSLEASVPANAKFTDTTYTEATTSAAGLMSAADKIKIDNSVLFSEQNMTAAQQAQARTNIGAQAKLTGIKGQVVGFDANGNAVAQEAPAGGGASNLRQPDWNQSDESQPDAIKNKPFGIVGVDTVTWDGDITGLDDVWGGFFHVSDAVPTMEDLANGAHMVLFYPRTSSYEAVELTASDPDADGLITLLDGASVYGIISVEDSTYKRGTYFFKETGTAGTYVSELTIPGYTGFPLVTPIEEKYIPDTIARKSDITQSLVQADYAQTNTTKPDYIKNKPVADATLTKYGAFADAKAVGDEMDVLYDQTMSVAGGVTVANNPQAIHWDGTIGDREYVAAVGGEEGSSLPFVFVRLYDDVPDLSAHMMLGLPSVPVMVAWMGLASVKSNQSSLMPMATTGGLTMGVPEEDGYMSIDGYAVVIPYDNYSKDGVVFPKKGIYFMAASLIMSGVDTSIMHTSGFAIAGNDFSKGTNGNYFIEKEEISGTINLGDTITWDGTTTNQEVYPSPIGLPIVRLADCTLTIEELDIMTITGSVTLPDGTVVENLAGITDNLGSDVATQITMEGQASASIIAVHADNVTLDGVSFKKRGFYAINFGNGYISSLTISQYNFVQSKVKTNTYLKNEHLEILDINHHTNETHVGETLKWDGEIEGREFVHEVLTIPGVGVSYDVYVVRVSSSTPTYEQILAMVESGEVKAIAYTPEGLEETLITQENLESFNGITSLGMCMITYEDNTVFDMEGLVNMTLPHAGVYFITEQISGMNIYTESLTLPGYDFVEVTTTKEEIIKTEYLPEALRFGGTGNGGDTLTWDGNTDGRVSCSQNMFFKVSDVVLTLNDVANGATTKTQHANGTIEETSFAFEEIFELFDGILMIDGVVSVDAAAVGVDLGGLTFNEAGTYFPNISDMLYISSLTIHGYTFKTIKKIDHKYLPDALQFGQVIEQVSDTLVWDGNTNGRAVAEVTIQPVGLSPETALFYHISDDIFTYEDVINSEYISVTPSFDDEDRTDALKNSASFEDDGFGYLYIFNVFVVPSDNYTPNSEEISGTFPKKGIYFGGVTSLTISGVAFHNKTIKTIDPKYLPAGYGGNAVTLESLGITATPSEINMVKGVTRSIQSQLDNKAPAYTYGTEDLIAGQSYLATGRLYFVYE